MPRAKAKKKPPTLNNLVVISDTHCGCGLALCPPEFQLDDKGVYKHSKFQAKVWAMWEEFWNEWVPEATRGEPFGVVHNGDAIDGVHHNSVTQISNNLTDQGRMAYQVLKPVVEACEGRYWHIRGTEAHVGKSGSEEEALAERLGAIPNDEGQFARYELWKKIGDNKLVHLLHHISPSGSPAGEATAPHKELVSAFVEAAMWGRPKPNVVVRSHRHRFIKTEIPTSDFAAYSVVTPAWQGKTPFVWKIASARQSTPQFGGILIREAHGRLFIDEKIWSVGGSNQE